MKATTRRLWQLEAKFLSQEDLHVQSQTSRAGLLRQLGFFSATALVISNR